MKVTLKADIQADALLSLMRKSELIRSADLEICLVLHVQGIELMFTTPEEAMKFLVGIAEQSDTPKATQGHFEGEA